MLIRNKVLLGTIVFLFTSAASLLYADDSHVRIVRISHAEGTVRLNNQEVTANTPLIEGNVLTTGLESLAEIEFEDGSTVRLAPETQVSLSQLARHSSGDALTGIDLLEGELELNMTGRNAGEFTIQAGSKTIRFASRGRFRVLSTHSDPLELAVWKGEAVVHDKESAQDAAVERNEVFTLSADDPRQYDIESGIETDALDQWSALRDQELAQEYVSTTNQPASPAPPVFSSVDFVDPCQPYWYPHWYPGLFSDCFSPSFAFAPLAYVPFYPPVFYHHHHHHPHIHPPSPPTTAVVVHRTFYPKPLEPGKHVVRMYNDETFKRSVPMTEQREVKARSKEESREKTGSPETSSARTAETRGSHPTESTRSADSHHSTNQSAHSSSSYSPHSSSSGSRGYSGGGSYSGGSSHSSSSGGSSSAGASAHSSSSSASSSGSSGRSH